MKIIKTRYLVNPEGMVVEEIQEVDELELKKKRDIRTSRKPK